MNKIVEKKELAPKIKQLDIENPEIAAKVSPGQFAVVITGGEGERFPLTVAGADPSKGTIRLIFNEVGKSSKELGTFSVGQELPGLAGPLGNPTEIENFGTVLCFGGGVMSGPLLYIAEAFRQAGNKLIVAIGARTSELLIFKEELQTIADKFYVCTDDGSEGYQGVDLLNDVLKEEKVDYALAMSVATATQKAICEITRPFGIKTITSLTPIMLDGTGMCGTCRVNVGGETKFACVDGPEFDGHLVDWDLLESRKRTYVAEERTSSLCYEMGEEFASAEK